MEDFLAANFLPFIPLIWDQTKWEVKNWIVLFSLSVNIFFGQCSRKLLLKSMEHRKSNIVQNQKLMSSISAQN